MTDLETAIAEANQWLPHARPIIKVYLDMEEACFLSGAWVEADKTLRSAVSKEQRTQARRMRDDYDEANSHCEKARTALYAMLEGIRDNYRCDHLLPYPYPNDGFDSEDAHDEAYDRAENFNNELDRNLITVEAAVRMVGDEDVVR